MVRIKRRGGRITAIDQGSSGGRRGSGLRQRLGTHVKSRKWVAGTARGCKSLAVAIRIEDQSRLGCVDVLDPVDLAGGRQLLAVIPARSEG